LTSCERHQQQEEAEQQQAEQTAPADPQ